MFLPDLDKLQIKRYCLTKGLNVNDLFEIRDYYRDNFNIETYFHNVVANPTSLSCKNVRNKESNQYAN